MNVGFVSLGCSKNLIDTEIAIGQFKKHNYTIVNNPAEAEIIVVNTCGFIDSAKEEAINTILEMAEYKDNKCKFLVVMGCLVQRYYSDLVKELPEVDLFIKLDEYKNFWNIITDLIEHNKITVSEHTNNIKISEVKKQPLPKLNEFFERVITTGDNYAYLKIGEGCSNNCTYCAIPYIRGPFSSRPMEDIVEEAKELAKKGIKELIVIAQDTTKYGEDLYGESKLAELLQRLNDIEQIQWVRFLYSYPEGITDELIDTVKNNEKICNYFDIPIQHISNTVLKRMNRRTSKEDIEALIEKIRNAIPNAIIRTSLIVGFPGETEEDFQELYNFVEKTKFDKLGVFKYSKEEGTPAEKLTDQIQADVKKARYNKIMKLQQGISKEKMKSRIGNIEEVLVEDIYVKDNRFFIGRTKNDVPEIDGIIYIKNEKEYNIDTIANTFIKCEIIDYLEYDVFGKIIQERLPQVWLGVVDGKNLYASWHGRHNQIRYNLDGKEVAVYDVSIMNYLVDPIIFRNNSIANELSASAKDKIQQLSRAVKVQTLKEMNRAYDENYKEVIARELGFKSYNLMSVTEVDLNQKIKVQEKAKDTKQENKIEANFKQKEKLPTSKDINIKQELEASSMASSTRSIGYELERAGKMPKVDGKKFTKLGIVESESVKDIDKEGKTNTTRFSFVAIANDGTVAPIDLEQDHAEGNNPREINYRTKADGGVEQDDVNSRYKIGKGDATIAVKTPNGPGEIEVSYSAHKTIGGEGIEGNVSVDHQLETKSVYWRPRKDSRDQEYADGIRGTEDKAREALVESKHDEKLKRGKKGKVDDFDEYKNIDGKEETKDSDHQYGLVERARKLISENDRVADNFTEEEVIKMLENSHDKGKELDKAEDEIKEDAQRLPDRLK